MALNWMKATGLFLLILTSVLIAFHAVGVQLRLSGDPSFHARFDQMPIASSMHVIGGAIVLFVGGFQFWKRMRARMPGVHRWLGRLYLSFVAIGGVGGLILAPVSDGGLVAHVGFGLLAVLWLFSGWQAYSHIRDGNVQAHREWMMRNYAMTFAAVTLRIYLGLFALAGIPFEEGYPLTAWVSWVPNLILVEWYLVITAGRHLRRARVATAAPA